MKKINCRTLTLAGVALAGALGAGLAARAGVTFLGVASGDATSTNAVLWTRAVDLNAPAAVAVTAQVSPDPFFGSFSTYPLNTDTNKDYTGKVLATSLTPNTKYYYRFTDGVSNSIVGTFKTAPNAGAAVPVHFGFSGDADGLMRPYALAHDFNLLGFDFFFWCGDTIYETASAGSPAVTSSGSVPAPSATGANQTNLYQDYSRKYREQFLPVNAGGQNCLQTFFASQGNYTLLDNHELGNKQYINGGALPGGPVGDMSSGAGVDARVASNDTNFTANFMNKSTGFQTLVQTYLNYQPAREDRGTGAGGFISAPSDLRTDGTKQLYLAQQWGRNAIFINTDDRSYRDIRMKTAANADDTGSRADSTNRAMLGATQLAWLEQTLLAAQTSGVPWKFIGISDPIDQLGPIGGALNVTNGGNTGYAPVAADGGKSWMGGYRAERNALLKFIADNRIYNVVFLATDDHQNRVNELLYSTNSDTATQASYVPVPHCFAVVAGPLGATGPDFVTNHTFANNKLIADSLAAAQAAAGVNPLGLDPNFPGLHNVVRQNDPNADIVRQPVDFYSPDTFNYNTFDVSADGGTLTIKSFGINSTAQNSFAEYNSATNPVRQIFSFQVDAANDLSAIDHIVVIYQENWSFDALYGHFPGANGLSSANGSSTNQIDRLTLNPIALLANYDPAANTIPTQNPPVPLNGTQDKRFLSDTNDVNSPNVVNTLLPYDLSAYVQPSDLTGDIVHRYWQEQFQIDHGSNDEFITWSDNPGLVMSSFDATPLPEGKLAQQYVMCDNFFHSAFGGSFLNHQYFIAAQAPVYPNAATLLPSGIAVLSTNGLLTLTNSPNVGRLFHDGNITPIGGVCFADTNLTFDKNYAVNTIFSANLANSGSPTAAALLPSQNDSNPADLTRPYIPTIGDRLDAAGIKWKWYSGGWDRALAQSPNNPTHYGSTIIDTNISLFQWHHQAFAFYDNYAPFVPYAAYVSNPAAYPGGFNPYSAARLQDEAKFFADVTNNTLPAVCFIKPLGPDNEHPGYASLLQGQLHVSNIVAAVQANPALWAHTAIIVTYDEHGGRWDHVAPPVRSIWGPGVRVPGIIISPLAKTNYVDHTQYETLSILKTIEDRFGIPPLTAADAGASSFAPAFNPAVSSIPDLSEAPTLGIAPGQYEFAYYFTNQNAGPHFGQVAAISNLVSAQLSWPAGYSSYILQSSTNVISGWTTVSTGSSNTFNVPVDGAQAGVFYRLIRP